MLILFEMSALRFRTGRWLALTALAVSGAGVGAADRVAAEPAVDPATAAVMVSLHRLHQDEVDLAKLAEQSATRKEVRRFAGELRHAHEDFDRNLSALARDLNVDLEPQRPRVAVSPERARAERFKRLLRGAKQAEVDRIFLAAVIDIDLSGEKRLREAVERIDNADVKKYASAVKKELEKEIEEAQSLQETVVGSVHRERCGCISYLLRPRNTPSAWGRAPRRDEVGPPQRRSRVTPPPPRA